MSLAADRINSLLIVKGFFALAMQSGTKSDALTAHTLDEVVKWRSEVAQSCPTLWDPIDCSLPGSSVYGIFQAIVLKWIVIYFSRGSSRPRARTQVSHIVDRGFTVSATREVIGRDENVWKAQLPAHNQCSRNFVVTSGRALFFPHSGIKVWPNKTGKIGPKRHDKSGGS